MNKSGVFEILAMVIGNFLILFCFGLLLVNITQFPFPGEFKLAKPLYVLGFIGVAVDLFAISRTKRAGLSGIKYPKFVLILFVLIHVLINSGMFYYVRLMMQL